MACCSDTKTTVFDYVLSSESRAFLRHHELHLLDDRMPEYLDLLSRRGADECWHKHGTFKEHLFQVWRILKSWGQPQPVCRLGLFHSSYSNSYVNLAIFDPGLERKWLQDLLGPEAEELVYLFCVIPRQQLLFEDIFKTRTELPADGIMVKHIRTGEDILLTRDILATFVVATIADLTDQWFAWQDELFGNTSADNVMRFPENNPKRLWPGSMRPGLWMHWASRMGSMVRNAGYKHIPPIFDNCTKVVSAEDELVANEIYWKLCNRENGIELNHDEVEQQLLKAIRHNPFFSELYIVIAQLYIQESKWDEALTNASKGLKLLVEWGTACDKRMPWEGWIAWARVMQQSARDKKWVNGDAWGLINLGLVK